MVKRLESESLSKSGTMLTDRSRSPFMGQSMDLGMFTIYPHSKPYKYWNNSKSNLNTSVSV